MWLKIAPVIYILVTLKVFPVFSPLKINKIHNSQPTIFINH